MEAISKKVGEVEDFEYVRINGQEVSGVESVRPPTPRDSGDTIPNLTLLIDCGGLPFTPDDNDIARR